MARGKKYQKIKEKIEKKEYSLEEAIDFIKENRIAKFDESIEIHIKLGIDPKKTEQQVKGNLILPYPVKKKKIACFVELEKEKEAKEAGADLVGGKELIEKIRETKKTDFEIAIATPEMMKELAPIAKILGPKGLMPSPRYGTVTTNISKTIQEIREGKTFFQSDEGGNVHQVIGKVSWQKEKIIANIKAFLEAIKKSRPAGVKGNFIKNITLCSTMGPGLKIK